MYTVDGASGSYNFGLPKRNHEHMAFMTVTLAKEEVEFNVEAFPSEDEGMVMYSAVIGEPGNGAKITVGWCIEYSSF